MVFHNGSKYDYHFIIKELAEEFKKQFACLGKNTQKHVIFTISIEKEVTRIDKKEKRLQKNLSYILQFIDDAIFMTSSLSNLVNDLSQGFSRIKCKLGHDDKKYQACGISIATLFLNTQILKIS